MTIRCIERGDSEELAALIIESFADEIALAQLSNTAVRRQIRSAVAASRRPASMLLRAGGQALEFWVATDGTRIVGCYALHGSSLLTLANLAVRPDMRGHGIGGALLGHAVERANQLGRRGIHLEVLADNEPAVRLYRSAGLREYDCRRSYTLRSTSQRLHAPPNPRVQVVPIARSHVQSWSDVLAISVPPEAMRLAEIYRSEYVASAPGRWLGELLPLSPVLRRAVLVDGEVAGFIAIRVPSRQALADVQAPLYTPVAEPVLADIILVATQEAIGRSPFCRLHVSEARSESHVAAAQVGYQAERLWSYMYRLV